MAFERFSKKLYFNISWAINATLSAKYVPCTPFRPSITLGDRYGSLLQPLAALTGNTPNELKRAQSVTAWYQPRSGSIASPTSTGFSAVYVDFVAPTLNVAAGTNVSRIPLLPYLSSDGTTVARNVGTDTIYGTLGQPRHFSVRLRRDTATTVSMAGVLYVARQHSIEV